MTELKKKLIEEAILLVKEAINKKISLNSLCVDKGRRRNFVANLTWELKDSDIINQYDEQEGVLVRDFLSIYDRYLNSKVDTLQVPVDKQILEYDAYDDDSYEERSKSEIIRGDEEIILHDGIKNKKIISYAFNVKRKDKPDFVGELTREEMDMVYSLYSSMDGAGLTQRTVSRFLPRFQIDEFKLILRAFRITKSSHPVAPHILEENSLEEVTDIIYRNKERGLFKKMDEERGRQTERSLKDVIKENIDLKAQIRDWRDMCNNIILQDVEPFKIEPKETDGDRALIVYLSDMHVGAKTQNDSIYENKYDEVEFNSRLMRTCDEIVRQHEIFGRFDRLIICNLGDSLDGYNAETTRGGHGLPQNMSNKEQFDVFVNGMIKLFNTLYDLDLANHIDYMCVGDANHDGDFGYAANRTVETYLIGKYPDMSVRVFYKFIEHFEYGQHTFILTHGKDKEDKPSGFKLNLDVNTELYFDEYLCNKNINTKNIHVVSGDLHQTSINYAKRFRYKKVSSLYGSSKWIHSNFGNTPPAVDFEIVPKNSGTILEGRLVLR